MRPAKKEIIEIDEEPDLVGHKMRRGLKKKHVAHEHVLPAKTKEFSVEKFHRASRGANRTSVQIVDDDDDDDVCGYEGFLNTDLDSQYGFFLDQLRGDEISYVSEYDIGDGFPICLRYEADDETYTKTERIFISSKRLRTENGREYRVSEERLNEGLCSSRTVPVVRTRDTQQRKRDCVQHRQKASMVKKHVQLKTNSYVSCQRKSRSDRVQSIEVLKFEGRKKKSEKNKVVLDDESYKVYLKSLDAEESSRISPEKSPRVKCGTKNEVLPDSDIIAVSDHPFSDEDDTPFVAAKNRNVVDIDEKSGKPGNTCYSWFKKDLRAILIQPYDEMEFVKLFSDVSNKEPIIRHRELRDGRLISYQTDIPGHSYLEEFPDFERRLLSCGKDRRRALNLLRGFFFYLKNLAHDCAFKPWQEKECLKTMS